MLFDEIVLEKAVAASLTVPVKITISDQLLTLTQLTPAERIHFGELESGPRRDPWLKGRWALKQLLRRLGEDEDTAKISFPNPRFSLTHSGNLAVAIGTPSKELLGIGVDLEVRHVSSFESARFFLTPKELMKLQRKEPTELFRQLHRLWTIKEALFKSDSENHSMSFVDYSLEDLESSQGRAFVVRDEQVMELQYVSLELGIGFLSVAIFPRGGDRNGWKIKRE